MKTVRIVVSAAVVVAALVGGILLGSQGVGWLSPLAPIETVTESRSSQIISAVNREEQIVLLGLGIQGVESKDSRGEIFGWSIPGSEKTSFLRYSFFAKLGVEGKDVSIEEVEPNRYIVSIPEFILIGHDQIQFEPLTESGGLLSATAAKVDQSDMTNQILSDEHKGEYIAKHEEVLRNQAELFYTRIITSIDPSVIVEFTYDAAES